MSYLDCDISLGDLAHVKAYSRDHVFIELTTLGQKGGRWREKERGRWGGGGGGKVSQ